MNFDENLKKMEQIAERLNDENLTLEDSYKVYNEGVTLGKECLKAISEIEGKIFVVKAEMDKYKEVLADKESINESK